MTTKIKESNQSYKCIIYAYEDNERISVNTLLVDEKGQKHCPNNWTFDLLSEELFSAILNQILSNYKNVKSCYLGLPGINNDGDISSSDFIEFSDGFIDEVCEKYNLKFNFVNDINAATYGYYTKQLGQKESNDAVGVFFPENFAPGIGMIINGQIYNGTNNAAGEIKNVKPNVNWDLLSRQSSTVIVQQVSEILTTICSLMAPPEVVVYSEYITDEIRNKIIEDVYEKIESLYHPNMVFKKYIRNDFEDGMAGIACNA